MVPNAEVEHTLPDTLPADFGEWDSSATEPSSPKKVEVVPVNSAAPKPPAKAATARTGLSLVADRLSETAFLTSVAVGPQVDLSYADVEDQKWPLQIGGKNKKMLIIIGMASVLLLILIIVLSVNHRAPQSKMAPLNQSAPLSPAGAMPTANAQPATNAQTATSAKNALATASQPAPAVHVQSDMMNDQLSATAVIPQNIKTTVVKETPPASSFTVASMDGLGGSESSADSTVFKGQGGSQVKVVLPAKVSISAGVAAGLALHKTAPFYPAIAKTARVSGTVVLEAVISKTGAIQKMRVVSGPSMLQQSALDAVKTWRYKPYMLNNEPVDVETTVNVVFALGD